MANRNQVTLTFAGDTSALERAARRVSRTTDKLGKDFDKLGSSMAKKLPDTIFATLSNSVSAALKSLPAEVQAVAAGAGAGIAAIIAPAIGAGVTAGVLLGVGGGVLALGIKAAAKDPAVQAAFKTLGDRANKVFANFGTPFQGPLIRAADTFGDSLERMAPSLNRMAVTLAPVIDKLAPALASMAENALPGIEKAAVASVPLFEKLAEYMPLIGSAISVFFEEIAGGSEGATTFFGHLLTAIGMTIIATGKVFHFLADKYQELADKGTFLKRFFGGVADGISAAFTGAWNAIKNGWNNTVGRISFRVPDWVPNLGGKGFSMPRFHQGGIVSGAMGQETLAVLRAGERVTATAGSGGQQQVTLRVVGNDRALVELIKRLVRIEGGGDVQAAFGR